MRSLQKPCRGGFDLGRRSALDFAERTDEIIVESYKSKDKMVRSFTIALASVLTLGSNYALAQSGSSAGVSSAVANEGPRASTALGTLVI